MFRLVLKFFLCVFVLNTSVFSHNETFSVSSPDSSNSYGKSPDENKIFIHEIKIIGNNKTKADIILRELTIKTNSFVTESELEYNENRIFSLGIFSDVKLIVSKEIDRNVLLILVQESWYIWPLPFINIADRDWNKITYGLHLNIQNLTGRNENLSGGFSLGYDPQFYLSYYNPVLNYEKNLLLRIQTKIQRRKNKSYEAIEQSNNQNYHENYFLFDFLIGKRIDLYSKLTSSISYEYLKVDNFQPLRTVSQKGIDRFLSLQFSYLFDTRDFTAYPRRGTNLNLIYRKVGLGESEVDFNIFVIELKKIQQLGLPIIYFRNYSRILAGPILPYYANSFIGYQNRVRGYFNQIFEANSTNFTTFELRFPVIEKYFLQFNLPLIPDELLKYTLSFDIHAFYDAALMFNKKDKLLKRKWIQGFGFGFSLLVLPYRSFNIEIGWNENFKHEFIFDVNFPF